MDLTTYTAGQRSDSAGAELMLLQTSASMSVFSVLESVVPAPSFCSLNVAEVLKFGRLGILIDFPSFEYFVLVRRSCITIV